MYVCIILQRDFFPERKMCMYLTRYENYPPLPPQILDCSVQSLNLTLAQILALLSLAKHLLLFYFFIYLFKLGDSSF